MRVYFVRHGESEENAKRVLQGPDSKLTELGKSQANYVAGRFKNIPIDLVLSSDMERAKKTADAICRVVDQGVKYSKLLREMMRPEELWGIKYDDPKHQDDLDEWVEKRYKDEHYKYSSEENLLQAKNRAKKALEFIENQEANNIVVVTHGTFLRMLAGAMMGNDEYISEFFKHTKGHLIMLNTGITLCEVLNGEWSIITWNDHAHLG
jgi:broad specificity phosphatase PhoE